MTENCILLFVILSVTIFILTGAVNFKARNYQKMASRGRSNFSAKVNKFRRSEDYNYDDGCGEDDLISGGSFYSYPRIIDEDDEAQATSKRFADIEEINRKDEEFGFFHFASGPSKVGWILNMKSVNFMVFSASYLSFSSFLDICKRF